MNSAQTTTLMRSNINATEGKTYTQIYMYIHIRPTWKILIGKRNKQYFTHLSNIATYRQMGEKILKFWQSYHMVNECLVGEICNFTVDILTILKIKISLSLKTNECNFQLYIIFFKQTYNNYLSGLLLFQTLKIYYMYFNHFS